LLQRTRSYYARIQIYSSLLLHAHLLGVRIFMFIFFLGVTKPLDGGYFTYFEDISGTTNLTLTKIDEDRFQTSLSNILDFSSIDLYMCIYIYSCRNQFFLTSNWNLHNTKAHKIHRLNLFLYVSNHFNKIGNLLQIREIFKKYLCDAFQLENYYQAFCHSLF